MGRGGYAVTKDDVTGDDDVDMVSGEKRKTERDIMWEMGGPGVYSMDYRKNYLLNNDDYKFDVIPEIMDGKNIADFVDPDIELKLAALEEEEDARIAEKEAAGMGEESESDLDSDEEAAVSAIREKKAILRQRKQDNRKNTAVMPRSVRGRKKDKHDKPMLDKRNVKKTLEGLGVEADGIVERGRERGRKRSRKDGEGEDGMDVEQVDTSGMSNKELKRHKREEKSKERRSVSVARSHSKVREPSQQGLRDDDMKRVATKKDMLSKRRFEGMSGEGDQRKTVHLVKWMNTGKKRNGTHNKR
jgi:nucleolar GTP-binding protein